MQCAILKPRGPSSLASQSLMYAAVAAAVAAGLAAHCTWLSLAMFEHAQRETQRESFRIHSLMASNRPLVWGLLPPPLSLSFPFHCIVRPPEEERASSRLLKMASHHLIRSSAEWSLSSCRVLMSVEWLK